MNTADRADTFLARQALHQRLINSFKDRTPDDRELAVVSHLAELAIDRVFAAYHLDASTAAERHALVKDYAECATLYGYVLGFAAGRAASTQEAA